MGTIRFAATLVQTGYRYQADLAEDVSVGSIARFLSQHDAAVNANTMELARLIEPAQRLQDIHLQTGDRLVIIMQPPHYAELPAALHPGDRVLKFSLGEYEVSSRGKKLLLVGRSDEMRQIYPDIDLRYFIPSHSLGYISRQCLRFYFDDAAKQWYALKTGQTRLMIDDFELGDEEVALDGEMWLRFYRASDNPKSPSSRPVGALRLQVEEVQAQADTASLRAGLTPVSVCIGSEYESQTLNASENLVLEQIVTGLARYHQRLLTPDARLYLMRLLSPEVKVGSLNMSADEFLYAPRHVRYTENMLLTGEG